MIEQLMSGGYKYELTDFELVLEDIHKNPKKYFDSLFPVNARPYFKKEDVDKLYDDVMSGKMGIHIRLIGSFWSVEGMNEAFEKFQVFAYYNNVKIKVTWESSHPGGSWGIQFFGAEISDCKPFVK